MTAIRISAWEIVVDEDKFLSVNTLRAEGNGDMRLCAETVKAKERLARYYKAKESLTQNQNNHEQINSHSENNGVGASANERYYNLVGSYFTLSHNAVVGSNISVEGGRAQNYIDHQKEQKEVVDGVQLCETGGVGTTKSATATASAYAQSTIEFPPV